MRKETPKLYQYSEQLNLLLIKEIHIKKQLDAKICMFMVFKFI